MIPSFHHISRDTFGRIISILNYIQFFLNPIRYLLLFLLCNKRIGCLYISLRLIRFPSVLRIIIVIYIFLKPVKVDFVIAGCFIFIWSRPGAVMPSVLLRWFRLLRVVVGVTFDLVPWYRQPITMRVLRRHSLSPAFGFTSIWSYLHEGCYFLG